MIDKSLEVMSYFDWISPALSIAGKLAHGGGYGFNITSAGNLSGREVQKLLKRNGIQSWAPQYHGGTLMLDVRKEDAQRAYQLLTNNGVVIENPPPQTPRRKRQKSHGGARQSGGVFSVFDIFDERR